MHRIRMDTKPQASLTPIILSAVSKKVWNSFKDLMPIILVIAFFQIVVLRQPLPNMMEVLLGAILVVLGLTLFVQGLEMGLFPIGETMAHALARKGSLFWLLIFAFSLGFSTTVAEPALIAVSNEAAEIAAKGNLISPGKTSLKNYALGLRLSVAFSVGIAIVIADLLIRYPEDTNVPVPQALLFYPAVGFVAEVVFHLVPLVIVLLVLSPLRHWFSTNRVVWIALLITAISEPTFQILFKGEPLTWESAYTWAHVFAIAFMQLQVFRRYDFASMYAFRLIYYAYWHIIWGVIRLEVLF